MITVDVQSRLLYYVYLILGSATAERSLVDQTGWVKAACN